MPLVGVRRLFSSGRSRRATALQTVGTLAAHPHRAASRSRSSASVASGCARTSAASTRHARPATVGAGPPDRGLAAIDPVPRRRASSLVMNDTLTPNRSAISGSDSDPSSRAATTRSRKSSEYAFMANLTGHAKPRTLI